MSTREASIEIALGNTVIGESVPRNEDARLVRGAGCFLDDVDAPEALHAAFVRSPVAHGRIVKTDVSRAQELKGVAAVYTSRELGSLDRPVPCLFPHPAMETAHTPHLLAQEEVCHVGQVIAMVIARNRALDQFRAWLVAEGEKTPPAPT